MKNILRRDEIWFDKYIRVLKSAGVAIPRINSSNPVHGISLMKHILSGGKDPLPERSVVWELTGKVAVRKGKWKLGVFSAGLKKI